MSIYMNEEQKKKLYESLYRLARHHVPLCTLEQVKKVANQFHENCTRQEAALFIYWELREEGISESSMAYRFIERLDSLCAIGKPQEEKKPVYQDREVTRDYWKGRSA